MLLSAVMCAKPLCHCNVNIKLYINQIYVNTNILLSTWLCIESDVVFFLTLSGISCVAILKYTLILSPQFTISTENKTSNQKEIFDEIKRSISISVYYRWKRSIKNGRWRKIDLKIIFWLQISYSPHSGTNTKIKIGKL
jgi:hypothetical protein